MKTLENITLRDIEMENLTSDECLELQDLFKSWFKKNWLSKSEYYRLINLIF